MKTRAIFRSARRWNLRTKIAAWFLVPTAVILIMVTWATLHTCQQLAEKLVIDRDRELTRLIADELARQVVEYDEFLTILNHPQDVRRRKVTAQSMTLNSIPNIAEPRVGEHGCLYLVDETGKIIYHSDNFHIGQDLSDQPVVQRVLSGETGALRTHDAEGQEIVASFAPVPGTNWSLINEESWQELIRPSLVQQRFLPSLLVLGMVASATVGMIGLRQITRPIAELQDAAQELAGGNFEQTINVRTGDELEDLAEQFNRMAAQLQESYQGLERKVADRTQELAALNAVASSVNESLDLDETLNRALDEILTLLDLEVGEIRLLNPELNELIIRTQRGLSSDFIQETARCRVQGTLPGQALLSGQRVIQEQVQDTPSYAWA